MDASSFDYEEFLDRDPFAEVRSEDGLVERKIFGVGVRRGQLALLRREIEQLEALRARPVVPLDVAHRYALKVESFLVVARSALDILSTAVSRSCLESSVQSFNALRKRGDLPQALAEYLAERMEPHPDKPVEDRGWLSYLMTEKDSEQSLRDFTTHRGVVTFDAAESFEGTWDVVLHVRKGDQFVIPVLSLVNHIMEELDELLSFLVPYLK